ncbi:MAG: hypothetical protein WA484_02340 [Solirubrobacteraceae bacterium]
MPRGTDAFSVGYELTETVRAAILAIHQDAWIGALDQDGRLARTGRSVRSPVWSICRRRLYCDPAPGVSGHGAVSVVTRNRPGFDEFGVPDVVLRQRLREHHRATHAGCAF